MYLQINKYQKETNSYEPIFFIEANVVHQEENTLYVYNQNISEYFTIPLIGYSYRLYDETFINPNLKRLEWEEFKKLFYSELKGYYLLAGRIYEISIEDNESVSVIFDYYDRETESFVFNGTLALKFDEFTILNKCS